MAIPHPDVQFDNAEFQQFTKELSETVIRTTYMKAAQLLLNAGYPLSAALLLIEKAAGTIDVFEEIEARNDN